MDDKNKELLTQLWGQELTDAFCSKLEKYKVSDKFLSSFNHGVNLDSSGLKTLELMTISAYLAQGIYGNPLKCHLIACKRLGISKDKLIGAIMHLSTFIGFPRIVLSLDLIEDVYASNENL